MTSMEMKKISLELNRVKAKIHLIISMQMIFLHKCSIKWLEEVAAFHLSLKHFSDLEGQEEEEVVEEVNDVKVVMEIC